MNRMIKTFLCIFLLIPLHATNAEENVTRPGSVGSFSLSPSPRFYGADIELTFRGKDEPPYTIFSAELGGAWEKAYFYRLPDGSLYRGNTEGFPGITAENPEVFNRLNFNWKLGVIQGIHAKANEKRNLLSLFLFYRGRYDRNDVAEGSLADSPQFPNKIGLLQNTLTGGIRFRNTKYYTAEDILEGMDLEFSVEAAPKFLLNSIFGNSQFSRLNCTIRYFFPVFSQAEGEWNIVSGYLGFYGTADVLSGPSIPLQPLQSFGGSDYRDGLGGTVRGLGKGRFAAPLKGAGSVEFRMNLPSLLHPNIIPGVFFFTDSGFYYIPGSPSGTGSAIYSAGGGITLNILNFANLSAYTALLLNEKRLSGSSWTPIAFGFSHHF